jgi:GTP-binding protein
MEKTPATIALVGRSNVGKSSLFNRLTGHHAALVEGKAGTTRDRHEGVIFWAGRRATVIDCGGLDLPNGTELERAITEQAKLAIDKAQLILFVLDVREGVMPDDRRLAADLRKRLGKDRVVVVANKTDRPGMRADAAEFASLGLGHVYPTSATNGSGVGDLLDEVFKRLNERHLRQPLETPLVPSIRIAMLGRTNVGKSSIGNSLIGQQRLVVSSQPHTTRTAISVNLVDHGELFEITDTAGINRSPTHDPVAKKAQAQTLAALNSCDVALLVTDASEPLTHQDRHLAGLAAEVSCGLIIVANKWDLLPDKDEKSPQKWAAAYRNSFPFLSWAPIAFTSAASRQGVPALLATIREVYAERGRTITDNALTKFLKVAMAKQKPLSSSSRTKPFLSDFKQTKTNPPHFAMQVRAAHPLSPAYVRYLQNALRQKFGFVGVPIHIDLQQATMGGGRVKKKYKPAVRRY